MEKKPNLLLAGNGGRAFGKLPSALRSAGFPVGTVSDFQEALLWMEKTEVDALILDEEIVSLGTKSAIESIKSLRPRIDLIIVLRDVSEGHGPEWMSAGSALCIPRSFPPESLEVILLGLVENRLLRSRTLELEKQGRGGFGARNGFLTTLAYEIKAPLTTIAGATKMLMGRGGLDKPGQIQTAKNLELVEMIKRNTDRILGFIGEVLELERIRRGEIKCEPKSHAPSALLDEAFGMVQKKLEETQVGLVRKPNGIPPDVDFGKWMLWCDREQIVKVLQLLTMTCAHTNPGPREVSMGLRAEADGLKVVFWVEGDSGGVESVELGTLFEIFRDLDASEGRKGTYGLTLYLCKMLVELNGGKIWAESDGVGKSMRYAIGLPVKAG